MHQVMTDAAFWVAVLGLASYFIRKLLEDRSINKAIGAEVGRLMKVIERHRDFWQKHVDDKTTSYHPLIPFSHVVYDKQIRNIGVIRGKKIDDVVRFYGYIDYLNRFQALRDEYENSGHTDDFNQMYIDTLSGLLGRFKNKFPTGDSH